MQSGSPYPGGGPSRRRFAKSPLTGSPPLYGKVKDENAVWLQVRTDDLLELVVRSVKAIGISDQWLTKIVVSVSF